MREVVATDYASIFFICTKHHLLPRNSWRVDTEINFAVILTLLQLWKVVFCNYLNDNSCSGFFFLRYVPRRMSCTRRSCKLRWNDENVTYARVFFSLFLKKSKLKYLNGKCSRLSVTRRLKYLKQQIWRSWRSAKLQFLKLRSAVRAPRPFACCTRKLRYIRYTLTDRINATKKGEKKRGKGNVDSLFDSVQ